MKVLLKILALALLIIAMFKIVSVKRITEDYETGTATIESRKTKIKHIAELATATQTIRETIDTVKTVRDALVIDLVVADITLNEEMKQNRLLIAYTYRVKAGFRNIAVFKTGNGNILVEHPVPEILSFELLKDTTLNEEGTWSKTQTDNIDRMIRNMAKTHINRDSLYRQATISMKSKTSEIIRNITGQNIEIIYRTKK